MYMAVLEQDQEVNYKIKNGRKIWVHIASGKVNMNGYELSEGDGVGVENEKELFFSKPEQAKLILFDMKPLS